MKNERKKSVYILIAIVIALVIIISAVISHNVKKSREEAENESLSEEMSDVYIASQKNVKNISGDTSVLFVCTDDTDINISFIGRLDFIVFSSEIRITPYIPYDYDGIYSVGGIDSVIAKSEKDTGIDIDRYIVMSKKEFISVINSFDNVNYNIDENFTYESSDKNYSVRKGENSMNSSMVYEYLKILFSRNDNFKSAGGFIQTAAEKYLNNINPNNAVTVYNSIINSSHTDLTAADYYSAESGIEYMLSNKIKVTVNM